MKKLILVFCIMLTYYNLLAIDVPPSTYYVNDNGNLLSKQEFSKLNQLLKLFEDSTTNQIAVLTLSNFDDQKNGTLFDFSMEVFKTWKIGQTDKDNGVLLVVVKNLSSKNAPGIRIVTGYGVEGSLPDAVCKRIIENIRPLINDGKYYQGIDLAIASITSKIKGEFSPIKASKPNGSKLLMIFFLSFAFIIFLILLMFLYRSKGNPKNDVTDDNENAINNDNEIYQSTFLRTSTYSSPDDSDDNSSHYKNDYNSSSDYSSSNNDDSFSGGGGESGGGGAGD